MNTKDITTIISEMKGLMPESSRTELAVRFLDLVSRSISGVSLEYWGCRGAQQFISDCALTTSARPWVPMDFDVPETKLAEFCNRWMAVEAYRLSDDSDELKPISAEMNGLRYSMISELKQLGGLDVPADELPDEVQR